MCISLHAGCIEKHAQEASTTGYTPEKKQTPAPRAPPCINHFTLHMLTISRVKFPATSSAPRSPSGKKEKKKMAEGAIISFAQKLGVMVLEEYKFLHGVHDQVMSLRDELQWISSFLKDAAMQGNKNERVDIWVSQIRDLAYDAEDVLDIFILKVKQLRKTHIRRIFNYPGHLITLHNLGNQIDGINRRIDRISTYKSKYAIDKLEDIESLGKDVALDQKGAPHVGEDGVVGFESQAEKVKMLLKQENLPQLHVVSIVGMPGVGKTTLAHKVYNDLKYQFDSSAWIYVSQKFKSESLLQSLKNQNISKKGNMGKLLIVFDDVRKRKDWDTLQDDVLGNIETTECTVLLTSRFGKVAKRANSSIDPYDITPLDKENSLELLKKKVFPEQGFPDIEWEKLGKEIVDKCDGLPLAIVVLGGLLSRKQKMIDVWKKVLESVRWQLLHSSTCEWLELLSFSYDNLPNFLKPCFLYFGLYPEGRLIDCEILIQIWIAEGFIEERGEQSMEDVAEDYLNELIQRNMIEAECRRFNGRLVTCRIHNLLREFAISKGRQDKFLDIFENKGKATRTMSRRLAIHSTNEVEKVTHLPGSSSLNNPRSILCFNVLSNVRLDDKSFYKSFKLVRVLDLRGVYLLSLPDEIGKLVLLKYLNLRGTSIIRLPSSLRNVRNLQTLDISDTQINGIPWLVWELEELRHFYANLEPVADFKSSDTGNGFSCKLHCKVIIYHHRGGPLQIGRLKHLRTLSTRADNWLSNDFSQLTNLRKLEITGVNMVLYGEVLSNSIMNFVYLRELDIDWDNGTLQLPESFSQHIHLYKLRLSGVMGTLLSDPSFYPPNLTELHLCKMDLKQQEVDSMETLAALKNLKFLELQQVSFFGNQMFFPAEGFPNLLCLDIICLEELEEWKVGKGSLPKLELLNLVRLDKLKELPDGLQQVTSLKKIRLLGMPQEFLERVKRHDWYKIKHIPTVKFTSEHFAALLEDHFQ